MPRARWPADKEFQRFLFGFYLTYLGFSIRFVKRPVGSSESKLNTNQGLEYIFEECVCVNTKCS